MYTTLKYEKTWLVVEEDGKPIWLGYVTETEKLFDLSYKLYAEGVLGYLQRFVPKVNGGTYYLTTDNQLEQWSSVPSNSIFYLATQALKDYYQGPYGTFGIGKVNIQPGRTIDTSSKGTLFESQWSLLNTFAGRVRRIPADTDRAGRQRYCGMAGIHRLPCGHRCHHDADH